MLIISSCKTKKEVPMFEEEKVVLEKTEKRVAPTAVEGENERSERLRRPKIDPEQIVAQLNMSESQETDFLDFWEKNQAEMVKIREESKGDRAGMREKMKAFRESSQSEIENILTPEQYAQYKQILAKDRMKSRRGGR